MSFNKLKVRLDLSRTGLEALFKPHEQAMLDYVWGFTDEQNPAGTLKLMEAVNEVLPSDMSRATIINAAYRLSDELGILGFKVVTGKGGHKRLYYAAETEAEFWGRVAEAAKQGINESAGKQIL